jgi:S1-C subfamily serine protease
VLAIGNPLEYEHSVTAGIVSAKGRKVSYYNEPYEDFIQTDAAINRGNSGGPLLDSKGRVIGVNTAIFSPTGVSAGVGFAVPIDTVKRILPDLLTLGRYRHPWLGVRYGYTIQPGLAQLLNLSVEQGILLVQLYENSPLDKAGARAAQKEEVIGNQIVYTGGDILTAIDGVPILSIESLDTFLENQYKVGDVVKVSLLRAGAVIIKDVTLSEESN